RVLREHLPGFGGQCLHVLAVLQNWNPFTMLMCRDACQAFEHLVPLDEEAAMAEMVIRKDRAPDRVRMKHRACSDASNDCDVQQRFGGRLSGIRRHRMSGPIDLENLFRCQLALVEGTGRDCDAKRLMVDDGAEISTRAQSPAALVEFASDPRKLIRVAHP